MPPFRSLCCAALVIEASYCLWRENWGPAACALLMVAIAELMTIREALTRTTMIS